MVCDGLVLCGSFLRSAVRLPFKTFQKVVNTMYFDMAKVGLPIMVNKNAFAVSAYFHKNHLIRFRLGDIFYGFNS